MIAVQLLWATLFFLLLACLMPQYAAYGEARSGTFNRFKSYRHSKVKPKHYGKRQKISHDVLEYLDPIQLEMYKHRNSKHDKPEHLYTNDWSGFHDKKQRWKNAARRGERDQEERSRHLQVRADKESSLVVMKKENAVSDQRQHIRRKHGAESAYWSHEEEDLRSISIDYLGWSIFILIAGSIGWVVYVLESRRRASTRRSGPQQNAKSSSSNLSSNAMGSTSSSSTASFRADSTDVSSAPMKV